MKKILLFGLLFMFSIASFAQGARSNIKKITGESKDKDFRNKQRELYHHWSVEGNVGFNKPIQPFAYGYYASDPERFANLGVINHFALSTRYMASNIFGFKFGVDYDKISNLSSSMSPEFKMTMYTATFEGVLNLGRLCRFETFTSRWNVLAHAGLHTSFKKTDSRVATPGLYNTIGYHEEQDGGIIFGLTPEYRLSKRIFLTADFTMLNNYRQHINWDGSKTTDNNLNGQITYTTLGLTVALGKGKDMEHADWYVLPQGDDTELQNRVQELENKTKDTDKDGVPDYLDLEKGTAAGAAVDSKGRTVVVVSAAPVQSGSTMPQTAPKEIAVNQNVINELVEKGYLNIFFDTSRDYPNVSSTQNVFQVIHYLRTNPTAKIKLVGSTDRTGDVVANKDLSERRAKNIFNLITGSGIKADRLSIEGLGVDNDVPNSSETGKSLARRVSIILLDK